MGCIMTTWLIKVEWVLFDEELYMLDSALNFTILQCKLFSYTVIKKAIRPLDNIFFDDLKWHLSYRYGMYNILGIISYCSLFI